MGARIRRMVRMYDPPRWFRKSAGETLSLRSVWLVVIGIAAGVVLWLLLA